MVPAELLAADPKPDVAEEPDSGEEPEAAEAQTDDTEVVPPLGWRSTRIAG